MTDSPFNPLPHSTMRETEAYWKGVTDALWATQERVGSFNALLRDVPWRHLTNALSSIEDEDWINHGGSI